MSGESPRDRGEHGFAARGAAGPLIRAVAAYWWVVVLVAVATFAGALVYVMHRAPKYQADVHVLFTPLASGDGAQGLPLVVASADPTRDAQTAVTLLGGPRAAALAASRLGGGWSAPQVTQATSIVQTGQSNIIAVEGQAGSPVAAMRLATTFAQASLDVRRAQLRADALTVSPTVPAHPGPNDVAGQARRSEIDLVLAGADPNFSLQGLAGSPSSTATPGAAIVLLADLGGVVLGIVAAILFDIFSTRVRDGEELQELYPVPVLGYLPRPSMRERPTFGKQVVSNELMAPAQLLASRLVGSPRAGPVLLATGASPGDGATTSALQLARALIAAGQEVLFIDGDLRTADATRRLGVDEHRLGLMEVLAGEATLTECLTWAPALPELQLLPAGQPMRSGGGADWTSAGLARQLGRVIREARGLVDYVLVDTAPLARQSDWVSVIPDVDEILVIARPGHTRRAEFVTLRDLLDASRSSGVNLVVVGERSWRRRAPVTPATGLDEDASRDRPARAASAKARRPRSQRPPTTTRADRPTRAARTDPPPGPGRTEGTSLAETRRSEA